MCVLYRPVRWGGSGSSDELPTLWSRSTGGTGLHDAACAVDLVMLGCEYAHIRTCTHTFSVMEQKEQAMKQVAATCQSLEHSHH